MLPKPKTIIFTKEGYEEKQREYEALIKKRPNAVLELKRARELGDLSENGAYKAARFELSSIDRQLRRLKMLLDTGVIVEHTNYGIIEVGSTVTVEEDGKTSVFTIVGGYESDPSQGKISHMSPIGRALIGKKVGESVHVAVPSGVVIYTVNKVL